MNYFHKYSTQCLIILFYNYKYGKHLKEKSFVLNGLKEKAALVSNLFNSMKGIRCNELQGAMYAFPKIDIPKKAAEYARVTF